MNRGRSFTFPFAIEVDSAKARWLKASDEPGFEDCLEAVSLFFRVFACFCFKVVR
jgi:hypothetical protein